jgi:iron complex outermembrane receptor protein
VATEAGFRSQPRRDFSYEAAFYVNRYDDLRSQDPGNGVPLVLGNTVGGRITGIELGATWEPFATSRLHGSYTWLHRAIRPDAGSNDISGGEGNDAPHLATVQMFTNLSPNVRFNVMGRYVAALPRPTLSGYAEADVTVQWDIRPWAEIAVTGQNLLHDRHPEFTSGQLNLEHYERSVFVTLTLRRR